MPAKGFVQYDSVLCLPSLCVPYLSLPTTLLVKQWCHRVVSYNTRVPSNSRWRSITAGGSRRQPICLTEVAMDHIEDFQHDLCLLTIHAKPALNLDGWVSEPDASGFLGYLNHISSS
jgi:hypothetical protein